MAKKNAQQYDGWLIAHLNSIIHTLLLITTELEKGAEGAEGIKKIGIAPFIELPDGSFVKNKLD